VLDRNYPKSQESASLILFLYREVSDFSKGIKILLSPLENIAPIISVEVVDFDDFSRFSNVVLWCAVSVDARLNVNVALNRPSFQVDTYGDYIASYANDGNHDPHIHNLHCMHTNGENTGVPNPWWAVDLGAALKVCSVKFTNRDAWGTYAVFLAST